MVEYEGLHLICFEFGKYGHGVDNCTSRNSKDKPVGQTEKEMISENPEVDKKGEVEAQPFGP